MSNRLPGLLGRLPGKVPVGLHDLGHYVAGSLPSPPPLVTPPVVGAWGMLGNDQYGDCGVAGLEHGFMASAALVQAVERQATAEEAVDYYKDYTDGQDSGVVLSDYLAHVRQYGYFGRSVDAYAPVPVQDVRTLQTAVWLYGFAYTGIVVTHSMQVAFATHQPWTVRIIEGQPPIGGHCVPIVGYSDNWLYAITWGGVQQISYSAWHRIASESWAVLTGELVAAHGDGRGVNLAALRADLDRL